MGDPGASKLTRRGFVTAAGTVAAATVAAPGAIGATTGQPIGYASAAVQPPLGSGGRPTSNGTLARLAREHGQGEPSF
jgi:hypothetical protein